MIQVDLGNVPVALIAGPYKDSGANFAQSCGLKLFAGADDQSCIYFADFDPLGVPKTDIHVIDASGADTWFSTGVIPNLGYITNITPLGPGLFLMNMSGGLFYYVKVSNAKLNNATPIRIFPSANPLSNPCYSLNPNVFYDGAKQLLAVGFYQPAGQNDTNIYATIYDVSGSELVVKNSGFVCNAPPNTFDQTASNGIAVINFSAMGSNGVGAVSYIVKGTYWALARNVYSVTAGGDTNCNDPCGASVSSLQNNNIGFLTVHAGAECYLCDSGVPNFAGLNTSVPMCYFTDGIVSYAFNPTSAEQFYASQNIALTKSHIFVCGNIDSGGANVHGAIYVAANPGIKNGTQVFKRGYFSVNNTRAVSPSGRFRT